jgi:hypothetical protein
MTILLRVAPDGAYDVINRPQSSIEEILGTPVTFVGALPEADAFVVATRECIGPVNALCIRHPECFHDEAHGDVIIFASDANGGETDLNVDAVVCLVSVEKRV